MITKASSGTPCSMKIVARHICLIKVAVVHGKRDSVAEDLSVPLRGGTYLLQRDRLDAPAARLAKQPTNVLGLVAREYRGIRPPRGGA